MTYSELLQTAAAGHEVTVAELERAYRREQVAADEAAAAEQVAKDLVAAGKAQRKRTAEQVDAVHAEVAPLRERLAEQRAAYLEAAERARAATAALESVRADLNATFRAISAAVWEGGLGEHEYPRDERGNPAVTTWANWQRVVIDGVVVTPLEDRPLDD